MARKPREFHKGGIWHIFNRGVAKENIFHEKSDFNFYLYKVKETLKTNPVNIYAYNLLFNHIHHLIGQETNKIPPSKFIGSLHTSFGGFINQKYSRAGHLFQDRFKANPVKNDLLAISFYVNLNKVLEKLEHFQGATVSQAFLDELLVEAEKDPWSSYGVYLGLRDDYITKPEIVLSLLSDDMEKARAEYKKLARDFLMSGFFLKTRDLTFERPIAHSIVTGKDLRDFENSEKNYKRKGKNSIITRV